MKDSNSSQDNIRKIPEEKLQVRRVDNLDIDSEPDIEAIDGESVFARPRRVDIVEAEEDAPQVRPARVKVEMDQPHIRPTTIEYIPESPVYEDEKEEENLSAAKDVYAQHDGTSVLIEILDWIKYILLAVIIGLLLSYFVIQRSAVVGSSMTPTLQNQDQLLVEKVSRHFQLPSKGSIITVDSRFIPNYSHDEMLVKRVVASPGDTIDFIDGKLHVNGSAVEEDYLAEGTVTNPPVDWSESQVVPDGHVYVLGDNRESSADSRVFGFVPKDAIVGHVLIRIYPFSRFGSPE